MERGATYLTFYPPSAGRVEFYMDAILVDVGYGTRGHVSNFLSPRCSSCWVLRGCSSESSAVKPSALRRLLALA
ncbi:hypothetical protein K443DRAFT_679213, partial [Laccaria amethystina LaAM-08-1]